MKKYINLIIALVLCLSLVGGTLLTPTPVIAEEETGTIEGQVIDSETSLPIANLRVEAFDYDTNAWVASDNTDASGNYTLVVPSGIYKVRAKPSASGLNYVDEYYNNTYSRNNADPVTVTAPGATTGKNFSMEEGGTIEGQVIDSETSLPIANLRAEAFDYDTNAWVASDNTDASGNYTLVVPSGIYKVRAKPSASGLNYVDEYYNNTYSRNNADPVTVTAPDATAGINFSLEEGGTIEGQVIDSATSLPIVNLRVEAKYCATNETMASTNTDASGNYSVLVPTGMYKVMARGTSSGLNYAEKYYNNTYSRNNANPVSVTAPGAVTGINFSLEEGGTIEGQVIDSATSLPIANLRVSITDYATNEWMINANTDADGNYSVVVPSGIYKVKANGASSGLNYVDEYYDNKYGSSSNADPVSVTAPDATTGINIGLEVGGTIEGQVIDSETSLPIANLRVSAFDYDTNEYLGGGNTDASGNYRLVVPTGIYKVRATASDSGSDYANEYYNNTYSRNNADPVSVTTPDATAGINFSLEEGGFISGTVRAVETGLPIVGVTVSAHQRVLGDKPTEWVSDSKTKCDGSYRITVHSGEFTLQTRSPNYALQWHNGSYTLGMALQVEVIVEEEVTGIDFDLEPAGTISGTVYDESSNPLPNILVSVARVIDLTGDFPFSGVGARSYTDALGKYTIAEIPYEKYIVSAGRESQYGTQYWGDQDPVVVSESESPTGIDFYLAQGNTIRGVVTSDGQPVPWARVSVISGTSAHTWPKGFRGSVSAGGDGSYEITSIPECSFWVKARAPGYYRGSYPDSLTMPDIPPLSFTGTGQELSNIDFNLLSGAGGIEGFVYQGDGITPVKDARVEALTLDGGSLGPSMVTTSDGRYNVGGYLWGPNLPPGIHEARIFAPGIAEFRQNVTIVADTISRVDFTWHSTDTGTDVTIEDTINEVTVTFDEVTGSGETWVTVADQIPAPDAGFTFLGTYYDISTQATYSDNISITIHYDDTGMTPEDEEILCLLHWNELTEVWDDVTVERYTAGSEGTDWIRGEVSSLSLLTIGIPPQVTWLPPLSTETPYQAQAGSTVPIKFQLTDTNDNPVSEINVVVTITDSEGVVVLSELANLTGNHYHLNAKSNWDPGMYTIRLSTNQDAIYDLILVEEGKANGKGK
ncbi:carboxypeptidase regulatory-like domain-containing protein [Chloroflexota bacterium]